MSDRLIKIVGIILPAALSTILWSANAVVMRSKLTDVPGTRAFFHNMVLFAVVVTGVSAASVAWGRLGLRGRDASFSCSERSAAPSFAASLVVGVIGLALGTGLTGAIVAYRPHTDAARLFAHGIRLLVPIGVVFSLIGAIAGDLGTAVVSRTCEGSACRVPRYLWALLVAVHALWFALAWIAVGAMKDHLPGM
jgi:hypothetical protein